jgi:hypothetical protein
MLPRAPIIVGRFWSGSALLDPDVNPDPDPRLDADPALTVVVTDFKE